MATHVDVGPSTIPDAGQGLFLYTSVDDGDAEIPANTIVTWYVGELLTPPQYFALDAGRSPRVPYVHAVKGTPYAVAPTAVISSDGVSGAPSAVRELVTLVHGGSAAQGANTPVDDKTVVAAVTSCDIEASVRVEALGHFANDRSVVSMDPSTDDEHLGTCIRLYTHEWGVCDAEQSTNGAEVYIDTTWTSSATLPSASTTAKARPSIVAFPVRLRHAVRAVSRGAPIELFLRYGVSYWVARGLSELYWGPSATAETKAAARHLRRVAVAVLVKEGVAADGIPALPPNVRTDPASNGLLVDADKKVNDSVDEAVLTDEQVRLVGLELFNRDLAVIRLPVDKLRLLLVRILGAPQKDRSAGPA